MVLRYVATVTMLLEAVMYGTIEVVIGKGSGIMSLPGDARANLTVSPQSCTI